ncbi:MAG: hypothetical protein ACLPKI_23520 [Streptosporangiaceae bacterium]
MITGRGPGAPGMTPGLQFTRRRAGQASSGTVAADLGEIRRAGQAIDLLAARAAGPPELLGDPALALLGALAADVDTPGTAGPGDPRIRAARRPASHREPAAGLAARGLAGWPRAAVTVALAGLAGTTSLIAASMLARLTGGRTRPPDRGWAARPARPRRFR